MLDVRRLVCPREARIAEMRAQCRAETFTTRCRKSRSRLLDDAALFAAAGMETVNYGATGAGAHEAVEWADLIRGVVRRGAR